MVTPIAHEPHPPMPFIVGVARSGTTLLRLMIDAHPDIAIPPETHFLPFLIRGAREHPVTREEFYQVVTRSLTWCDFKLCRERLESNLAQITPFSLPDALRCFYRTYAARFRKSRVGDKTPHYAKSLCLIESCLPEAHFIHIIRDGRDVAMSQRKTWGLAQSSEGVKQCAQLWVDTIEEVRRQGSHCGHFCELHYEYLIASPRDAIERICAFVGLPFDSAMLDYHRNASTRLAEFGSIPNRITRGKGPAVFTGLDRVHFHRKTLEPPDASNAYMWSRMMSKQEIRLYEGVAGETLLRCGYRLGAA
jgi:hypothetical protein